MLPIRHSYANSLLCVRVCKEAIESLTSTFVIHNYTSVINPKCSLYKQTNKIFLHSFDTFPKDPNFETHQLSTQDLNKQ